MEKKEKINLKRLNSVLKKNSIKIILILFLFTLCGYFYSYNFVVPEYKSTSTILLASNNLNKDSNTVTQTDVNLNKNLISTYGKILKSNNVLGKVINNLDLDMTEEELYKNVQIEEVDDTQIIQIGVIDKSAIKAQEIADELNNVFIEEIKQIYKMDNINIVDKASLEMEPYNVNHIRDILGFLAIGIVFSIFMISIIYFFDTTIKIDQDVEEYIGLNVVGTIPKNRSKEEKEIVVQNNSKSIISEALKAIRTNLSFTQSKGNSKSILFTSCNAGEGKSWVASNMAVAYAQSNKNVIIVDADMRKGRQHKIFDVKNVNGLSSCLKEISSNEDYEILKKYIQQTGIPKVHIITIGAVPPNPSELLLSNNMSYLIHMLKCVYDVVIIDGTPCNLVSDSIPVSRIVDTTILVTESRKTKIEDLRRVVKSIKNAEGNIGGVILNKKEIKSKEYGKGYYYGEVNHNANIELQSYTVEELIKNRKEYNEEKVEEQIESNQYNDQMNLLAEKIEGLENKLLEIPNMNLESYTKVVEDIRKIYKNEIDKNKLAEDIKENIIKNELVKKINESNIETKDIIEQKLEELNYKDEIKGLIDRLNNIEDAIDDNVTEEKIADMISEMKEEQNKKLENLDSSETLNQVIQKIEEQNKKIQDLDSSETLSQVIQKIEEQNKKIQDLDNSEILSQVIQKIEEQNKKIQDLDSSEILSQVIQKIEEQNKKIQDLDSSEVLSQITQKVEEQNKKIQDLDSSRVLNNIVMEMQKLNAKYEKVDIIEKMIENDRTEENIAEMIYELKQEQNIKLEELNKEEVLNDVLQKVQENDNADQIKEIMNELKKINTRYDKLAEKIRKNLIDSRQSQTTTEFKDKSTNKNNIIEMNEFKKKMEKQELIIEYGEEIEYEKLLDLAVGIYEIKPEENHSYYISNK